MNARRKQILAHMGIEIWQQRRPIGTSRNGCGRPAELLLIGEKPITGPAATLLEAMLAMVGLNRQSINELSLGAPGLLQQIAGLKPALILTLGEKAAQFLLGSNEPLDHLRETVHLFGEEQIPLIVTHHPDSLLTNPKDKRKAFLDLQPIPKKLNPG